MRPGLWSSVLGDLERRVHWGRWGVWTKSVEQIRGVFRELILTCLSILKPGWGHRGQCVYVAGGVPPTLRTPPPHFLKSVDWVLPASQTSPRIRSPHFPEMQVKPGSCSDRPGQPDPRSSSRTGKSTLQISCAPASFFLSRCQKYGRFHFEAGAAFGTEQAGPGGVGGRPRPVPYPPV